jgi:hypothetical protein
MSLAARISTGGTKPRPRKRALERNWKAPRDGPECKQDVCADFPDPVWHPGEIDEPKPGKRPAIRFFLDATPTQKPLSMTDLVVIQQGLHQFIDAVKDETAQMMAPQRKKPKKKA